MKICLRLGKTETTRDHDWNRMLIKGFGEEQGLKLSVLNGVLTIWRLWEEHIKLFSSETIEISAVTLRWPNFHELHFTLPEKISKEGCCKRRI